MFAFFAGKKIRQDELNLADSRQDLIFKLFHSDIFNEVKLKCAKSLKKAI